MRQLLLSLALAGCIQPSLVTCPGDIVCPKDDVCDAAHQGCVAPAQLAACDGALEGTDCVAGSLTGACFDGVCLQRGCGNRVIEPGEQCDDGNQASGDGCRSDCASNETCGNGVLDSGEACDDGNLASRDGCDSRCIVEQIAWKAIGIAPANVWRNSAAYDPIRHRLVVLLQTTTWEFDGSQWLFTRDNPMGSGPVYWDPDLGKVVAVARIPTKTTADLFVWDAGRWTQISSGTGPAQPRYPAAAAYDAAGKRPIVIATSYTDGTQGWTVDATGVWQMLTTPTIPFLNNPAMAFDPTTNDVVIMSDGTEWDVRGATWTPTTRAFGTQGWSLAFNATMGHLVMVENAASNVMRTRQSNGSWSTVPLGTVPCLDSSTYNSQRALYYDPATTTMSLFSTYGTTLCEWQTGWTARVANVPFSPTAVLPDPAGHRFVVTHDPDPGAGGPPTQTWTWNGAWSAIATAHTPSNRQRPLAAYDLTRHATILYGGAVPASASVHDTWSFDGTDWTQLDTQSASADSFIASLVYEPPARRMLLVSTTQWKLGPTDTAWSSNPLLSPDYIHAIAWHQKAGGFLVTTSSSEADMYQQNASGTWDMLQLYPKGAFTMIGDQRTGGVVLIDLALGTIWELKGITWTQDDPLPMLANPTYSQVAYNPADGSIAVLAFVDNVGTVLEIRERTSVTPLESCKPMDDLDGDGLAGCADLDCYWQCSGCPPGATCP